MSVIKNILLCFAILCLSFPAIANDEVIQVTLGKGKIISIPGRVADVLVANPTVASVSAVQADKLYVVGSNIGDTNIMALDDTGNTLKSFNISVGVDTDALESMVRKIFPNEEDVSMNMIGDQLVLTGVVSNPTVAKKITSLVAARMAQVNKKSAKKPEDVIQNLLEVRGEQQVTLRVRIMEISRDVLREIGSKVSANDPDALSDNWLRGLLDGNASTGLTKDPFSIGSLILNTGINGIGDLGLQLQGLEDDNLGNILAEPNLTTVSGEKAGFLAGGEFPVPTGRDREGNIIVEYKEFGVSLNFKPIVLSEDRISVQLDTEVSSLNQGQGITLANVQVPGLDVRRASTTVELNSGGTLMIGGLLSSSNIKAMAGLPGIKDTPILGNLMASKSFQRQETELVVLVTPYLVSPFADTMQAKPMFESDLVDPDLPPPLPPALEGPTKEKKHTVKETPTIKKEKTAEVKKTPPPPYKPNHVLSKVFSGNLQKIYGNRVKEVPKETDSFGYILE
jgi:pilus assembly protein CpaC